MFGLFKAKPPLGPWEKAWTEQRMCWHADQFGMSRLLETPTLVPHFDGIPAASTEQEANQLVDFLQTWMKVDTGKVKLKVFSDVVAPESIGTIESDAHTIQVTEELLADRDEMIAKIASHLAARAAINAGVEPRTTDDAWTIGLLPVFLGLGVFVANAELKKPETAGSTLAWTALRQRGSLPARMTGYAMALRAWVRSEDKNDWATQLRQDAIAPFQDGLKYLEKTSDSIFSRDVATQPRGRHSEAALLDELRDGSPSRKISALWGLAERVARNETEPSQKTTDLVLDALRHKQSEVRAIAASTLPAFDRSQLAAQDLTDAINDSAVEVRVAAAGAMAAFEGVDDESIVEELTKALNDDTRLVVFNAARSLTAYGEAAEPATKTLLKRLRRAMVECRDDDALTIMWALNAILPEPMVTINDFFDDADAEYRDYASEMLEQLDTAAA